MASTPGLKREVRIPSREAAGSTRSRIRNAMCGTRRPSHRDDHDHRATFRGGMMGGKQQPGPFGASAQESDPATLPRIGTPAPSITSSAAAAQTLNDQTVADAPLSGGIPYAIGQASVVRIPIPGTNGLCIELTPRGWTPQGGSTSTLFFQDATGKRHLRLDYGYNVKTKTIDYHWNQKGTFNQFGIPDHAPAGTAGEIAYNAAKYFRYAGRVLVVVGVAVDVVSTLP